MVFGKKTDPKKVIEEFFKKKNLHNVFLEDMNQYRSKITVNHKKLGESYTYPIAITLLKEWIVTEVAIIDLQAVPSDFNREKIYYGMLQANFAFPEVNYALYNSMAISLAWSKADSLNIDNFESEFAGIMTGIEKFSDIALYANQGSFSPPKEFAPMYQ